MSSSNNRLDKLEKRVLETKYIELWILGEYISDDDYKIIAQAAAMIERALAPDGNANIRPLPLILTHDERALIEQAGKILQRVEKQYKDNATFRKIQIDVDMSKLSDAQLESLAKGEDLFKAILNNR
jgi:hypothetical protein